MVLPQKIEKKDKAVENYPDHRVLVMREISFKNLGIGEAFTALDEKEFYTFGPDLSNFARI